MKLKSLIRFFGSNRAALYKEGIRFFNNREYSQAIEKFDKIIGESSSTTSLHCRLSIFYRGQAYLKQGILLFALGNFSRAVPELEKAAEANPDNIDIYEYLGICYNNTGELKKAISAFEYFLERRPDHIRTRLMLEIAYHNTRMWDKAISICREILKKAPNYADVHFYLGLAYLGKGEANQALLSFENALRINPRYRAARIRKGITLAYLGNFGSALRQISEMVDEYPDFADLHYFLGIVHAGRDDMPEAVDSFSRALEINPSFKNARIKLGMVLCKLARFEDALQEFEQARKLDPADRSMDVISKRINDLICSYPNGFETLPEIFKGVFGEGGIVAQTIREFNEHLDIVPSFSEMLSIMKYFPEEDLSIFESLIPVVNSYIRENPHHPDLHNALGSLCVKAKKYDEGIDAFRKALDINPNYLEARFNLFKLLKNMGKLSSAAEEGEVLLEKGLSYPDFFCLLGEVYISMDMFERASVILRHGIEKHPESPEIHFLTAQAREGMGQREKAVDELKECLEYDSPEWLRKKVEEAITRLEGKSRNNPGVEGWK